MACLWNQPLKSHLADSFSRIILLPLQYYIIVEAWLKIILSPHWFVQKWSSSSLECVSDPQPQRSTSLSISLWQVLSEHYSPGFTNFRELVRPPELYPFWGRTQWTVSTISSSLCCRWGAISANKQMISRQMSLSFQSLRGSIFFCCVQASMHGSSGLHAMEE